MKREEFEALLEEAYENGYKDAIFEESCGVTESFVLETEQNINEWLDAYTEAGKIPSPKDVAMKIYERVIKSAKVAKVLAKEPGKADKIKAVIKKMAIMASKNCEKYKKSGKKFYDETKMNVLYTSIVSVIAAIVTSLPVFFIIVPSVTSVLINKAIDMIFEGNDLSKIYSFIKDFAKKHIGDKKEDKKEAKQESAEEPAITFSLESEYDKYVKA